MIFECAKVLDDALLEGRETERLTVRFPELSLEEGYRIQDEGIKLRLARGEQVIGLKMGFTSEAKRKQMNLGAPICGVLTDRMEVPEGGVFELEGKIHPKIEPEIAFLIAQDLKGRVSIEQALEACSGVTTAMEILDSRFVGFKYFSLPDVVADNCSSAYFVRNRQVKKPKEVDLANLKMAMKVDGKVVEQALSSAISGHPAMSLVQLCEILASHGRYLKAGSLVLAGAATAAVQMTAGMRVELEVDGFDPVRVSVV